MKTAVTNLNLLSQSLDRPLDCLMKHFLVDLGTNAFLKEDVVVLKGDVTSTIEQSVESFIKKYVQCGSCGNPETKLSAAKKSRTTMTCQACGNKTKLDAEDKVVKVWTKNTKNM